MKRKAIDFNAWIALSEKGYPALFIGLFPSRTELYSAYRDRFGHSLDSAGDHCVKVRVTSLVTSVRGRQE